MRGTFAGANIKGTPSMKAAAVRHDLRVLKAHADVFGVQEFKWAWYWRVAQQILFRGWASYPGIKKSLGHPVDGAQAVFWKRRLFKRVQAYGRPAFDFRMDNSGIMDNRFIRAVLLQSKAGEFAAWFLSTHFVVGGDERGDSPRRKAFMVQNLAALDGALEDLRRTGFPIMGELDANIHGGTWAYEDLMKVLKRNGATLHGAHGVEFAFTIPGRSAAFDSVKASTIPTSKLKTDHEVRVLEWSTRAR